VASLSQGRTAAAQCGLFTHKSVPVIFEPPCMIIRVNHNCYIKLVPLIIFKIFLLLTLKNNSVKNLWFLLKVEAPAESGSPYFLYRVTVSILNCLTFLRQLKISC